VLRPVLLLLAAGCALALAPTASAAGLAEIRGTGGRLVASVGPGSFSSIEDNGWTLRVDDARRTATGVELDGVSMAGGDVYADRVVVPARGERGARVVGLVVRGRPVPATPSSLVPLGGSSYLMVLQEAVVPGVGRGLVGLRLVAGDANAGIDPGSEVLVGLARAGKPPAKHGARLAWLALGVAQQASGGAPDVTSALLPGPYLPTAIPGDSIGQRAALIALRYLGVPYVWGGASPPSGFDCSGLTLFVYGQLGVSLTHYSGAQWFEGPRVPPAQLIPGDLVFFEPSVRGPQHVGIYIGGGQFVQAPHTGDVVKVSSLDDPGYALSYVGAVRPWATG
jgi:hypothetical protein